MVSSMLSGAPFIIEIEKLQSAVVITACPVIYSLFPVYSICWFTVSFAVVICVKEVLPAVHAVKVILSSDS